MAQNITLAGASYSDVPSIIVPLTAGGTASFVDTSDATASASEILSGYTAYSGGALLTGTATPGGLTWIQTLSDETIALEDTDYASWTPSTSTKAILATATLGTFTASSLADADYISRFRMISTAVYASGTSAAKGMWVKTVAENWYAITRRPSTLAYLTAGTKNYNVAEGITNAYISTYYSSASAVAVGASIGYTIYTANSAPTLSSTSAASPTVTVKRPIINARCSSTYFSTTMASAIDQADTTIRIVCDIYRADGDNYYGRPVIWNSLIDLYNNGIS